MDKVIKVISAKKKLTPSKNEKESDDKVAETSSHADYANGYILAHLDPESKSTVLREKKLVGNAWGGLIDEIIEKEVDTIKSDKNSNTKNNLFLSLRTVLNSTTPFLSRRSASPVLTPPPASSNFSTFQAKAPSPRSPRSQKKNKG